MVCLPARVPAELSCRDIIMFLAVITAQIYKDSVCLKNVFFKDFGGLVDHKPTCVRFLKKHASTDKVLLYSPLHHLASEVELKFPSTNSVSAIVGTGLVSAQRSQSPWA